MNKTAFPKTVKRKPPTIRYDGQHLFYNGVDLSDGATDMKAIITPCSTEVTVKFECVNVDMHKDFSCLEHRKNLFF